MAAEVPTARLASMPPAVKYGVNNLPPATPAIAATPLEATLHTFSANSWRAIVCTSVLRDVGEHERGGEELEVAYEDQHQDVRAPGGEHAPGRRADDGPRCHAAHRADRSATAPVVSVRALRGREGDCGHRRAQGLLFPSQATVRMTLKVTLLWAR